MVQDEQRILKQGRDDVISNPQHELLYFLFLTHLRPWRATLPRALIEHEPGRATSLANGGLCKYAVPQPRHDIIFDDNQEIPLTDQDSLWYTWLHRLVLGCDLAPQALMKEFESESSLSEGNQRALTELYLDAGMATLVGFFVTLVNITTGQTMRHHPRSALQSGLDIVQSALSVSGMMGGGLLFKLYNNILAKPALVARFLPRSRHAWLGQHYTAVRHALPWALLLWSLLASYAAIWAHDLNAIASIRFYVTIPISCYLISIFILITSLEPDSGSPRFRVFQPRDEGAYQRLALPVEDTEPISMSRRFLFAVLYCIMPTNLGYVRHFREVESTDGVIDMIKWRSLMTWFKMATNVGTVLAGIDLLATSTLLLTKPVLSRQVSSLRLAFAFSALQMSLGCVALGIYHSRRCQYLIHLDEDMVARYLQEARESWFGYRTLLLVRSSFCTQLILLAVCTVPVWVVVY